jgi:hypothetical protein
VIEPDQSDIGRKVIWRVHGNAKVEEGVITRLNEKYVSVHFDKEEKSTVMTRDQLEWKDARSRSSVRRRARRELGRGAGSAGRSFQSLMHQEISGLLGHMLINQRRSGRLMFSLP